MIFPNLASSSRDNMEKRFTSCEEEEEEEESNHINENCQDNLTENEDDEPKVGMKFNSTEEVDKYYKNYARCIGFEVSKISTKNGDDGKKYFTLGCNRARTYASKSKNILKPNPSVKTHCKARINVCVSSDGTIAISKVALEHNHDLISPSKSRYFRCNKNIDPSIKRRLEVNDQAGINVSRNFRSMVVEASGYDNLTFGEKDARNYIDKVRRLRLGIGDAEAIQNYFVRMQRRNSEFYYVMDVDDTSRLRNVFWADARCRAAYEYFGEVITFDTTYLTNKYDMPFAPFVGVNHHGQSILLGCALLSKEDTKTFSWLFTTWLECMRGRAPQAIITDQDRAMKNAVEDVFPKARHRWCLWHIMKKVPEKLSRLSNYESIKILLHDAVYDSLSISDFMEKWEKMIECYELHDNEWLKGLFDERHRWVPVYVRDTFWAGMSTTQRSESMNAFFDGYVNSKTSLKQFVEQYDNALKDKIEKENMADFSSFNRTIACISHFGFESQFQKTYTNAKFQEFQVEVASMMYCHAFFERIEAMNLTYCVTESKKVFDEVKDIMFKVFFNEKDFEIRCTCCLFEFKGILCRHILCVLKLTAKTESVPSCYILSRWRKDIKRRYTLIKSSFDQLPENEELQRVSKACDAFYEVASSCIHTENDLSKVMDRIENLKLEMTCQESFSEITEGDNLVQNQMTKILDPVVTRSKGRPPSKRKASKVDQSVKRKLARKKGQKSNKKNNTYQSQEEGPSISKVQENQEFSLSQTIDLDVIDTQESIHVKQMLAPFNPNQKYLDVDKVPYYSQSIDHNVSYLELLQAQHHINDRPSS